MYSKSLIIGMIRSRKSSRQSKKLLVKSPDNRGPTVDLFLCGAWRPEELLGGICNLVFPMMQVSFVFVQTIILVKYIIFKGVNYDTINLRRKCFLIISLVRIMPRFIL